MINDELVARRPKGRAGLSEWYTELFQAQNAEGLSMADLAILVGLTVANLYHWRRRLRAASSDGKFSMRHGLVEVTSAPTPETLSAPPKASPSFEVSVGMRRIEVPVGFDPISLRQLIAALESC